MSVDLPIAANIQHDNSDYEESHLDMLVRMQERHFWYRGRHRFLLGALDRYLPRSGIDPKHASAVDVGGGCGGWLRDLRQWRPDWFPRLALGDSAPQALRYAAGVVGPDVELRHRSGSGFVAVHAADNSFPNWAAYNEMIGLGGWGGRNEKSGPYVYYSDDGKLVRDTSPGAGGSHGPQAPFVIIVRDAAHPVTKGMPATWLHAKDELYDSLRGPAANMKVLATAYSPKTKRHKPMMMTIAYGKGRVFHTPMGHANESQECVGFITTFVRGAEWAATGAVEQPVPADFPASDAERSRPFAK